jgi:hypothetical protein
MIISGCFPRFPVDSLRRHHHEQHEHATETAAGISIGIKSGLFAAFVAVLTELLGFAIVPLAPGWEMLVGFWVVAGVMK